MWLAAQAPVCAAAAAAAARPRVTAAAAAAAAAAADSVRANPMRSNRFRCNCCFIRCHSAGAAVVAAATAAHRVAAAAAEVATAAAAAAGARTGLRHLHAAAAALTTSAAAAAETAETEPRYFARVKHVRDFPSVSVLRLLQRLQQTQQQQVLLQHWQAEAGSSDAQAISLLKRRLELLRLLQQLQQPEQQRQLLQQLPLLQPHEMVTLLLRITANIETLRDSVASGMQQQQQQEQQQGREEVRQVQQQLLQQWAEWQRCAEQLTRLAIDEEEALLIWTAMTSIRAFSSSSSSSSSSVLRTLLLQVRERLEAAAIASNARSRQPQHPEDLYDAVERGLLPPRPPAPPPRSWRSMDPVDMETWESSQRRVVLTRWLAQPSGVFLQGRKLAAALVLHIHQVLQQQQQQRLSTCGSSGLASCSRTHLRVPRLEARPRGLGFGVRLLALDASSLIPWMPSFVQLLRLQFALQRELAIHLAAAAEELLQQQHKQQQQQQQQTAAMDKLVQQTLRDGDPGLLAKTHPVVLPPLLLLQICGGMLAAQTFEMPLSLVRKFFANLSHALQRAAAFRRSNSSNSSNSNSSSSSNSNSMLLPLRDVAFFCSALKRSGLHEEQIVRQLLLQLQHDFLQLAVAKPAAAAAAETAAQKSIGVQTHQGTAGQSAQEEAEAPAAAAEAATAAAAAAATAAAATAAADAKQQLAAAEGSVADLCAILDAAAFSCSRCPAAAAASPAAAAAAQDFAGLFEVGWRWLLPLRLELSPPCELMLLNAVEAAGPATLRHQEEYRALRQHLLSAHADLDPEALGSLCL
ncbi:hypothetical protein Esti_006637 [Eimeria stiedai]